MRHREGSIPLPLPLEVVPLDKAETRGSTRGDLQLALGLIFAATTMGSLVGVRYACPDMDAPRALYFMGKHARTPVIYAATGGAFDFMCERILGNVRWEIQRSILPRLRGLTKSLLRFVNKEVPKLSFQLARKTFMQALEPYARDVQYKVLKSSEEFPDRIEGFFLLPAVIPCPESLPSEEERGTLLLFLSHVAKGQERVRKLVKEQKEIETPRTFFETIQYSRRYGDFEINEVHPLSPLALYVQGFHLYLCDPAALVLAASEFGPEELLDIFALTYGAFGLRMHFLKETVLPSAFASLRRYGQDNLPDFLRVFAYLGATVAVFYPWLAVGANPFVLYDRFFEADLAGEKHREKQADLKEKIDRALEGKEKLSAERPRFEETLKKVLPVVKSLSLPPKRRPPHPGLPVVRFGLHRRAKLKAFSTRTLATVATLSWFAPILHRTALECVSGEGFQNQAGGAFAT